MKNTLMEFKSNVKSQWGEDGIIEEIFNRLGIESPICIFASLICCFN